MSRSKNTQRETWRLEPETAKRGKKGKIIKQSLLLQHKLSEHKELKAETMKFSSHILFLPGLHFNQTHWQSSSGPGMTSIVVGGDEDGGKGRVEMGQWKER